MEAAVLAKHPVGERQKVVHEYLTIGLRIHWAMSRPPNDIAVQRRVKRLSGQGEMDHPRRPRGPARRGIDSLEEEPDREARRGTAQSSDERGAGRRSPVPTTFQDHPKSTSRMSRSRVE